MGAETRLLDTGSLVIAFAKSFFQRDLGVLISADRGIHAAKILVAVLLEYIFSGSRSSMQ